MFEKIVNFFNRKIAASVNLWQKTTQAAPMHSIIKILPIFYEAAFYMCVVIGVEMSSLISLAILKRLNTSCHMKANSSKESLALNTQQFLRSAKVQNENTRVCAGFGVICRNLRC